MRSVITTIFVGLIFSSSITLAQDSGFVERTFCDMTISISGTNTAIQCFEAARNSDQGNGKIYAFSPYFEFVKWTSDGKSYQVINSGDKQTVKMRLALHDNALKSAAASWISEKTNSSVSINDVLPLPIISLIITENNTNATTSFPQGNVTPGTSLVLSPTMDVYFRNLSADTAKQLADAIDKQQADFTFTYYYKTSSNVLGAYTVTYEDIRKNSIFNQLTGNGGVGFVTRNGANQISGFIAQSLKISSYVEDPSIMPSLTTDLLNLFTEKMQFNKKIDFSIKKQLETLNNLTIDPRGADFEAKTLNTLHDALKTSKDYSDFNKKITEANLSVGYGPFKANGGFKSNDEVNKAIKETFDHDWTGNDWSTVPKTINVYQVNGSDFQGVATIRQVTVKPTFSMQSFQSNPVQVYLTALELSNSVKETEQERFVLVPVGSVLAYSGSLDINHTLTSNWMVCDGRPLKKAQYPHLFTAIGTSHGDGRNNSGAQVGDFNLPDYTGLFLRGLDSAGTYDKGQRKQSKQGGSNAGIGTIEEWATGKPKLNFTANNGEHTHTYSHYQGRVPIYNGVHLNHAGSDHPIARDNLANFSTPPTEGGHSHTIAGGDEETRPVNAAVNWIIRVR